MEMVLQKQMSKCLSSSPYEIIKEAEEVALFECSLHEVQGRLSNVIPALGVFSAEGGQAGFGLYHRHRCAEDRELKRVSQSCALNTVLKHNLEQEEMRMRAPRGDQVID